jgi:hypothetical protein
LPVSVVTPSILGLGRPVIASDTAIELLADGLAPSFAGATVLFETISAKASVTDRPESGLFDVHAVLPDPISPSGQPISVRILAGGLSRPPFLVTVS